MSASNTTIVIFLCCLIFIELFLVHMKWTDPDTVSDIFTVFNNSLGLGSFTGNGTDTT